MSPLSLIVDDWPEIDRERWRRAQEPAGFLEADKPASRWSAARRRIAEQAYGQWLGFLDRNGMLELIEQRLGVWSCREDGGNWHGAGPERHGGRDQAARSRSMGERSRVGQPSTRRMVI